LDSAVHALGEIYQAGDLCIDVGRHRVAREGVEIPLPNLSFELLLALAKAHPRLLTTDELLETVWAPAVVNPETVGQRVKLLRQALGDDPHAPRYVVGVRGLGYRMDVPVTRAERDPQAPPRGAPEANGATVVQALAATVSEQRLERPDSTSGPQNPTASSSAAVLHALRPRAHPAYWIGSAAVALLLGFGLTWWLIQRQAPSGVTGQIASQSVAVSSGARASRGPRKVRLAILPFENLSPEPANAFFTEGMHEELITTLAERLRGVEVISRTTMTSGRVKAQPVTFVASTLGATHVIEGSVRREGEHVRVTLQLIDAGTDQHVWSKSYDRTLSSALTLQSEVADEVASQLSVQLLTAAPSAGPPTQDAEAYDQYLKAVVALRTTFGNATAEDFRKIDEMLSRAISRDPRFALAYAQRARTGTLRFIARGEGQLARVSDDLERAKSLAPREPMVIGAEGYYLYALGENERALARLDTAEELGVTDPVWLIPKTRVLLRTGRVEEAVRTQQRMLELDPADPLVIAFVVDGLNLLRRPTDAMRVIHLAETQFPDLYRYMRCRALFDFAGRTQDLRQAMEHWTHDLAPAQVAADLNAMRDWFDLLRYEHRYQTLDQLVQLMPTTLWAPENFEIYDMSMGNAPEREQIGGWSALLQGDAARAAQAGRGLLAYVKSQKPSPRSAFFLHQLEAQGHVFAGQSAAAIEAARASLELVPRERDAVSWIGVATIAARVYAWAGARDEAVTLLEQLATATPGLPPAYVTRDPLVVVPLAANPQYQALAGRLEAQMTALNLN
jgi:TolB-like protein/DNA-binding winged helix-turn-helix (wHTH) protein/Tfp pilus assembly protein PilF